MKKIIIPAILVLISIYAVVKFKDLIPAETLIKPNKSMVKLSPGEFMAHQRMYPYNAINQQNYLEAIKESRDMKNSVKIHTQRMWHWDKPRGHDLLSRQA